MLPIHRIEYKLSADRNKRLREDINREREGGREIDDEEEYCPSDLRSTGAEGAAITKFTKTHTVNHCLVHTKKESFVWNLETSQTFPNPKMHLNLIFVRVGNKAKVT